MEEEILVSEKKKSPLKLIIIGAVALVAVVTLILIFVTGGSERKIEKNLDLGDKYMTELNYEQAIEAYEAVLQIDPKNCDAYIGITYSYMYLENFETAYEYASLGYNETGFESFVRIMGELEAILNGSEEGLDGENGAQSSQHSDLFLEKCNDAVLLYDSCTEFRGGVAVVAQDAIYGAIDYEGNIIVPITYPGFYQKPTPEGRFVMLNGENYYLYDNKGNLIYSSPNKIIASKDYYIVRIEEKTSMGFEYGESQDVLSACRFEYYSFADNSLKFISEMPILDYEMSTVFGPACYYDGKEMIFESEEFTDDALKSTFETQILADYILENPYVSDLSYLTVSASDRLITSFVGYIEDNGNTTLTETYTGPVSWSKSFNDGFNGGFSWNYADIYVPYGAIVGGWFVAGTPVYGYGYKLMSEDLTQDIDIEIDYQYYYDGSKLVRTETVDVVDLDNCICDFYGWYTGYAYARNYGSKMILATASDKQLLVDMANGEPALLAAYDRIIMSDQKYWLVSRDGQWGYVDHDGNEVAIYEAAAAFSNGYGAVISGGHALIIDENFETVKDLGEAVGVTCFADAFRIRTSDESCYYVFVR